MSEGASPIVQKIEALAARLVRARMILATGAVSYQGNGTWAVTSSDGSKTYEVNTDRLECTCPDHARRELHKGWCKHRLAVELYQHGETGSQAAAE